VIRRRSTKPSLRLYTLFVPARRIESFVFLEPAAVERVALHEWNTKNKKNQRRYFIIFFVSGLVHARNCASARRLIMFTYVVICDYMFDVRNSPVYARKLQALMIRTIYNMSRFVHTRIGRLARSRSRTFWSTNTSYTVWIFINTYAPARWRREREKRGWENELQQLYVLAIWIISFRSAQPMGALQCKYDVLFSLFFYHWIRYAFGKTTRADT